MFFPTALDKFQHFYWIFIKNLQRFLEISQQCVFRPNLRKINSWFVKSFGKYEKYAKIMHFCNFLKKFVCNFSKILRRPGCSAPVLPTRSALTLNPPPRNYFLRTPLPRGTFRSPPQDASSITCFQNCVDQTQILLLSLFGNLSSLIFYHSPYLDVERAISWLINAYGPASDKIKLS